MWKKLIPGIFFLFLLTSIALPWSIELPEQIILDAGENIHTIPVELRNLWNTSPWRRVVDVWVSDPDLLRVEMKETGITVMSGFLEGQGAVEVRSFPIKAHIGFMVRPDYRDRDGDGFPDVAELKSETDRRLFRERFVAIARSQLLMESPLWRDRDCSGLVRFAYREALKRHDQQWFAHFGGPVTGSSDLESFHYPRVPVLGDRLFRIRPGPFSPITIDQDFSAFASAFYLHSYNTILVGKREERAMSGDLLFFYQPLFFEYPYHVMIYTGSGQLIYHTGPVEGEEGQLLEVTLDELRKHPDPRWRPVSDNPAFLGFYRWKILN